MQEDLPQPVVADSDTLAPAAQPQPDDAAAPPAEAQTEAEAELQPSAETGGADTGGPEAAAMPAAAAPAALSPAACGAKLIELFPALFAQGREHGPMKPMKLRIQADLQQRAPGVFSRRTLGIFFSRYTTGNAYLKALTLAPQRFGLDGQPAGEISDEHRRLAAEELARRHALAAERRAALWPAPLRDAPNAQFEATAGAEAAPSGPSVPRRPPQAPRNPPMQPEPRREPRRDPGPDRSPARGDRPPPSARPGPPQRPQRDARHDPHARGERGQRSERPDHPDRSGRPPPLAAAAPAVPLPVDPAQRTRALLVRSYDASPLSKANFCALKGITEADLDAALAQAQAERGRG